MDEYTAHFGWFYGLVVDGLGKRLVDEELPFEYYKARDARIKEGYADWTAKNPGGGAEIVDAVVNTVLLDLGLPKPKTHLERLLAEAKKLKW